MSPWHKVRPRSNAADASTEMEQAGGQNYAIYCRYYFIFNGSKPKPLKPEQGQEGSEEDRLAGVLKRLARLLGRAYAREWLARGKGTATDCETEKEKSRDA